MDCVAQSVGDGSLDFR